MLSQKEKDRIHRKIRRILKTYGNNQQMIVAAEECCELAHVLLKGARGNGQPDREAVLDEYADVWVMMAQVRRVFGFTDGEVLEVANVKVDRTLQRIKEKVKG